MSLGRRCACEGTKTHGLLLLQAMSVAWPWYLVLAIFGENVALAARYSESPARGTSINNH